MTQPQKLCPQCQTPTALQAQVCAQCSHQYRTQFAAPIHSTQMVLSPPSQTQQFGVHRSTLPAYGPRDQAEWSASCFWFWVWLWFSSSLCATCLLFFIHALPEATSTTHNAISGGTLVSVFAFGTWATFCAMRLRRLYVYFSAKNRPWYLSATLVVFLVIFGALGIHRVLWSQPSQAVAGGEHHSTGDDEPTSSSPPRDTEAEAAGAYARHESEVGGGTFPSNPPVASSGTPSSYPGQFARPTQPARPAYRTLNTTMTDPPHRQKLPVNGFGGTISSDGNGFGASRQSGTNGVRYPGGGF